MIEVANLTKFYGNHAAVSDVSFSVADGETVGFLGPNGAGKSTTMRILTGFLTATSGTAKVGGFDLNENPIAARKCMGYLPESTPLYRDMRVSEFLDYRARLKGLDRTGRKSEIGEALDRCRISDVSGRIIGQLSKGYRQRVGLADCLLGKPPLMILDEPTVGLDPNQVVETRNLIKEIGCERTVFLSTHILHEVELIADRVIIIDNGRMIAEGNAAELQEKYVERRYLKLEIEAPAEALSEFNSIKGVRSAIKTESGEPGILALRIECSKDADPRREIASFATAKGWMLQEMLLEPVRLEDIFAKLTGGRDTES